MKVVQVVTQMEAGGAQKVALDLASSLQKRGHKINTVFLYKKRKIETKTKTNYLFSNKPSLFKSPLLILKFIALLNQEKPDVIITHTHYSNIFGLFFGKLLGVKHRIAVQHNPVGTYPSFARIFDRIFGSSSIYTSNIAVSQSVIDSMNSYPSTYIKKLRKIYNGIKLERKKVNKNEVCQKWNLPINKPLLINIGRLSKQKNQELIIKSLHMIPEAHLIIVGDGELKENLFESVKKNKLDQRVHFFGEINSQEVIRLLEVSDIFVFPSIYEAMPIAVLEAMSVGIPIVCSRIPSLTELLDNTGIYTSTDNPTELAESINKLLLDHRKVSQIKSKLLTRASQFTLKRMVDSYEELFGS